MISDSKSDRLLGALRHSEVVRLTRMDHVKSKRGNTDVPLASRKLTQQEAAAYCGVSVATIKRWEDLGLKTVRWGKMRRYMAADLSAFMLKMRGKL